MWLSWAQHFSGVHRWLFHYHKLSAVASCFNNIGPGLDAVGPVRNFDCYSMFSKIVLTLDMLAGRLEIFPILILFSRSTWKNR